MKNSYLDMLSNTSSAPQESAASTSTEAAVLAVMPPPAVESAPAAEFQMSPELRELLEFVSPEFTPYMGNSDSPIEETPLMTPMFDFLGTPIDQPWESPALVDTSDFPLFNEPSILDALSFATNKPQTTSPDALMNTDHLYTMPSTPALAPSATLYPSPRIPTSKLPGQTPNGHRKGLTPAAMVPLEAPTQPRNYYTESKTSRKVLPAAFANKTRKRSREDAGFGVDEDDESVLTPDLEDAISAKRRQNTLAARKSRARKAETARQQEEVITALMEENQQLREEVEQLRMENEAYRRRFH
jgi:hypothetical protein